MALSEECKEKTLELISLNKQLQKLNKLRFIDTSDYLSWSADDIVDYLCTLNNGKYEKYSAKLRIVFAEEGVDGESIKDIDKPSLRDWGVNNFKDRANIFNKLQEIIHKNENNINNDNNNNDEGTLVGTAFIG